VLKTTSPKTFAQAPKPAPLQTEPSRRTSEANSASWLFSFADLFFEADDGLIKTLHYLSNSRYLNLCRFRLEN